MQTIAHSVLVWLPITAPWLYNQIRLNHRHRSIVLAHLLENLGNFPWMPILSFSTPWERSIFFFLRKLGWVTYPDFFKKAVKEYKPSILHSHFGDRGWYDLRFASKYRLRHVVTFYGYDVGQLPFRSPLWRQRFRELFDHADLFLCEGNHMRQQLIAMGCPPSKIKLQRIGVDLDRIGFQPRQPGPGGLVRILIAGSFVEKKGIPTALEAIGRVYKKNPSLAVTVIGDVSRGDPRSTAEKRKILEVIHRYRLERIVTFRGYLLHAQLIEEAYRHHLFLAPSQTASDGDMEGGAPVTLIEMSATGMPVLSTFHCDIPEVIVDGQTGLLVPERDPDALAEKLDSMIQHPEKWRLLGERARAHIEQNYHLRRQINQLIDHYETLLSAPLGEGG